MSYPLHINNILELDGVGEHVTSFIPMRFSNVRNVKLVCKKWKHLFDERGFEISSKRNELAQAFQYPIDVEFLKRRVFVFKAKKSDVSIHFRVSRHLLDRMEIPIPNGLSLEHIRNHFASVFKESYPSDTKRILQKVFLFEFSLFKSGKWNF